MKPYLINKTHCCTVELFDFCKKFNEQVTKKDLEEPTAHFVQTVFFKYLMAIGYSETLLNTNQSEFCILEELGEHAGKIFTNINKS